MPNIPPPPASLATPAAQTLRVMCVDDSVEMGRLIANTLGLAGHVITVFASASEALERFTQNPDAFDVLLTDQSMPYLEGTELMRQLRTLRPSLPCVLMTGLGDYGMEARYPALGVNELLTKPFSVAALCSAVERAARLTL